MIAGIVGGPKQSHRLDRELLAGKMKKNCFKNITASDYNELFYLVMAYK